MYRVYLALLAALVVPHLAVAGGYSGLPRAGGEGVPDGVDMPQFASSFLDDVLHSRPSPARRPSLILSAACGRVPCALTSTLAPVLSGRVNCRASGPSDDSRSQQARSVALKNGDARFSYKPSTGIPNGRSSTAASRSTARTATCSR